MYPFCVTSSSRCRLERFDVLRLLRADDRRKQLHKLHPIQDQCPQDLLFILQGKVFIVIVEQGCLLALARSCPGSPAGEASTAQNGLPARENSFKDLGNYRHSAVELFVRNNQRRQQADDRQAGR